ncbi:MAG: tyrosine-type recombinase/integrase [Syntrophales bacterium]|nr:tyrosine-type recombinase/integrase [Syntrophales bacterium]
MLNNVFSSNFKNKIEDFIEQKNACGFPYNDSQRSLKEFDRFCRDHYPQDTKLTREMVMHWAERRPQEHLKTLSNRIVPIRQLAKYLNRIGCEAYIIPPGIPGKMVRYVPHIFTKQELQVFFATADQYSYKAVSPVRHLVVPVIFRVLYCCGLRSSEATGLKVVDVDLHTGRILIRKAKGNKDRTVMLSQDVLSLCRIYHEKIKLVFPDRVYFFPNHRGNQYGNGFLNSTFHQLWDKAGISCISGNLPRVHDFRHAFAVKRLNLWVEEGKDLQAYLPYLSMYLGHAGLSETDYYLHLVPEFFPVMTAKAEEQFAHLIPEPYDEV